MHMHHHNTGGIAIDSYACNSRLRHISAGSKLDFPCFCFCSVFLQTILLSLFC